MNYDIGLNIKKARLKANMLQKEVAEKIYVCQEAIHNYESNKRNIPLEAAIKLADIYNISLDELIGRNYERKEK